MDGMIKIGDKTYGVDEFGEYGSLVRDDDEPEAPKLEQPPPPWPIDDVETGQTDETL